VEIGGQFVARLTTAMVVTVVIVALVGAAAIRCLTLVGICKQSDVFFVQT